MGAKQISRVSPLDLFRFAQAENCTMQDATARIAAQAEAKAVVDARATHRDAMAKLRARGWGRR